MIHIPRSCEQFGPHLILCVSSGRFFEVVLPVLIVALVLLILKLNINPAGPSIDLK